jgi:CheY-like chemotaxis protein
MALKRVLVVDDEEMIRELLGYMLETEGYAVSSAANGEAGLRAIDSETPDLVLLDLKMPGLDGWGVIECLSERSSAPRVVVMSGTEIQPQLRGRAIGALVYGCLSKPFTTEQLAKVCRLALESGHSVAPNQVFAEKRRERRRDLVVPATLLASDGTPAAVGQIVNLSTGGAQLDLGAPLRPGMGMTLSFEIPGTQRVFRVVGRIQWKKEGRLGLMFDDLTAEEKRHLGELLGTLE